MNEDSGDRAITGTTAADVVVVGGGLSGMTLGVALAASGVKVTVLDSLPPVLQQDEPFDGRASAIARASQQALTAIGVWDAGLDAAAAPILDIRVSDGKPGRRASPLFLHYGSDLLDGLPLGWIVENRALRRALFRRAAELPGFELLAPVEVTGAERDTGGARVHLADGRMVRGQLLAACDGRRSSMRTQAGIGWTGWDYPQDGLVCTISHSRPHGGRAHEHFLPSGPFAVLPLTDDEAGRHRSSIVWTERKPIADAVFGLSDEAFAAEVARRFGPSLGEIGVLGRRWRYPLSLGFATRMTDQRLALVGDAAHVIHPIAGQGFNLGLRDIAALVECVRQARRLGLDAGSGGVLAGYERWRRFDNFALAAVTDVLNRLFSNDLPPVRLARDVGLAAVHRMPGLKRLFMRHAMGMVGELPPLLRGEAPGGPGR